MNENKKAGAAESGRLKAALSEVIMSAVSTVQQKVTAMEGATNLLHSHQAATDEEVTTPPPPPPQLALPRNV